ncbi:MAG: glycosyltransferase family 2 protein, partial [Burkholderiales bacterium]
MLDSDSIIVALVPWFFVAYFVAMHAAYLLLDLLCLSGLRRYMASRAFPGLPTSVQDSEPPVSIVVPTHNQQETIAAALRALLELDYSEYEVIVVDDGSRDGTLARLQRDFQLVLFPEAYWRRLRVKHIYGVYRSATHPRLRVIDKSNGGKADALNAGINAARYPLFCAVDPESVLQRDSLR